MRKSMEAIVPGYRGIHSWVERKLGKPTICWRCKDTSRKRYAWSNNSGEYKRDLSDWERLCYPCHTKKDKKRPEYCIRGHKLSPDNLYIRPSATCRECKTCRKMHYLNREMQKKLAKEIKGDS